MLSSNALPETLYSTSPSREKAANNVLRHTNQKATRKLGSLWPVQAYAIVGPNTAMKPSGNRLNPSVTLRALLRSACIFSAEPEANTAVPADKIGGRNELWMAVAEFTTRV